MKATKKGKPRKCVRCRKNEPMSDALYRERLEDIPDGPMLCLPKPLCEDCLERIGDEIMELTEEG